MNYKEIYLIAKKNLKILKYRRKTVTSLVLLMIPSIIMLWILFAVKSDQKDFWNDSVFIFTIMLICTLSININNLWRIMLFNARKKKNNMLMMIALGMTNRNIRVLYIIEVLLIIIRAIIIATIISLTLLLALYFILDNMDFPSMAFFPLAVTVVTIFFTIAVTLAGALVSRNFEKQRIV